MLKSSKKYSSLIGLPIKWLTSWAVSIALISHLACHAVSLNPHTGTLLQTGLTHYEHGAYHLASNAFEQALLDLTRVLQADHARIVETMNYLGMSYVRQEKYERALQYFSDALTRRRKTLGHSHPSLAAILYNIASIYHAQGDEENASWRYQRALALLAGQDEQYQSILRMTLTGMGRLHENRGAYDHAMDLYQRALAIADTTTIHDPLGRLAPMLSLARLYEVLGEYRESSKLYRRVLQSTGQKINLHHPDWADMLSSIGTSYERWGEFDRAFALHNQALAVRQNIFGRRSLPAARSLGNLASLHRQQRNYRAAMSLYREALEVFEDSTEDALPELAELLNEMALVYQDQGQYRQSWPLHQRALVILEQRYGKSHPALTESLNHLGYVSLMLGEHKAAEQRCKRALAIVQQSLGNEHPTVARILRNLAHLYSDMGDIDQALDYLRQALRNTERHMNAVAFASSTNQKHARLQSYRDDIQFAIALHVKNPSHPKVAELAMQTVLRRKAFALDASMRELHRLRSIRFGGHERLMLSELAQQRSQLANLLLRGPNGDENGYRTRTERLWHNINDLERQLSQRSGDYRSKSAPITVADIQKHLRADEALVEIVTYSPLPTSQQAVQHHTQSATHYAAYILTNSGASRVIDLGQAVTIDTQIEKLRTSLRMHRSDIRDTARALDAITIEPIRPLLGDIRNIYLSPDGALNLIPFAALVDEQGRYLVETFTFTYLHSGRELTQRDSFSPISPNPMVVAAPAFDADSEADDESPLPEETSERQAALGEASNRRSRDMGQRVFTPLPGTAREAALLGELFSRVNTFTGEAATEAVVKQAKGPWILHIATHGFFLPDQGIGPAPNRMLWSTKQPTTLAIKGAPIETPLVRSGLALAGANKLRSGNEDGILTALELSSIDLAGTQLVVLSGCDTGVGSARVGQGIFGLRRALVLAGAQTQMVSLWPVDDQVTADLMAAYYKHLLSGEGRSNALHLVQREFLRHPRRAHPYYWASFIVSGDPSPLW